MEYCNLKSLELIKPKSSLLGMQVYDQDLNKKTTENRKSLDDNGPDHLLVYKDY